MINPIAPPIIKVIPVIRIPILEELLSLTILIIDSGIANTPNTKTIVNKIVNTVFFFFVILISN